MRSLTVRMLVPAFVLVLPVVLVARCRLGAPSDEADPVHPSPSHRRVEKRLLPAAAPESPDAPPSDPVAFLASAYATQVVAVDRETDGAFSAALRTALADKDRSVAIGDFRIPAREGIDDVMAAMPEEDTDAVTVHDQMMFVFMAAAIQCGSTEAERVRNVGFLAERYSLLPSQR